jgi:hypothetical protein
VLKRAWDTFAKGTFDPTLQRIGAGIGAYTARVDQHYQSVLTWATYSTDGRDFRERIEKGDSSRDELWRFLGSFVIIHFDFQSGDASRDAAGVVDRLKGLLALRIAGSLPGSGTTWSRRPAN